MPWHVARFAAAAAGWPLTENERRLLSLKNKCSGRRCFIIGNGPSLTKTPMEFLKEEITIGCNSIFLLFDRMGFAPSFYTVEDLLVAENQASEIGSMRNSTKVFPLDTRRFLRPDSGAIYVNFPRRYRGFPRFSERFERIVYFGGTVTYLNLQLAYYLGVKDIILVGMDHTFTRNSPLDERSGPIITSHSDDPDHFHPAYLKPGSRFHFPQLDRMEVAYKKAKEFLAIRGVRIRNATIGGKLEIFDRVEFRSLFP